MEDQTTLPHVSPVKLHHAPPWLRVRMRKRCGRVYDLHDLMNEHAIDSSWLDHWGSTRLHNGEAALVSEPYGLHSRGMAGLLRFAGLLGLDVTVHAASEWNPSGGTIRVLLTAQGES